MTYVSVGRTNYFKPKDAAEFLNWAASWPGVRAVAGTAGKAGTYCLIAEEGFKVDAEDNSITDVVAAHLLPGEVAIFQEAGHEGEGYVFGWSAAVNSEGLIGYADLNDIYAKAAEITKIPLLVISRAEY